MSISFIHDGIPTTEKYQALIKSNEFLEMEEFSNSFISKYKYILSEYTNKWVGDPLHNWSRQWEYFYIFHQIKSITKKGANLSILDAGSGITFFPYFLKHQLNINNIECIDNDESFMDAFKLINEKNDHTVNFSLDDISDLSFTNGSLDIIYCISVIEHTKKHQEIIDEFYRILKPSGMLFLTFDISLDGNRDIDIEMSRELLELLGNKFVFNEEKSMDLMIQISQPDIFTTAIAERMDPGLLPWKFPPIVYQFRELALKRKITEWPPLLTFYCLGLKKP